MADIAYSLRIKYGLEFDSNDKQIHLWHQQTLAMIQAGYSHEEATCKAARQVFPDFGYTACHA